MRLAAFLAATILVFTAAAPQALEPRQLNEKLFEAAKKGRTDEAIDFLRQGASVEARDRFGNTALLLAARTPRVKLVRTLLDAGSEIDRQNLEHSRYHAAILLVDFLRSDDIGSEAIIEPDGSRGFITGSFNTEEFHLFSTL